MLRRVLKGLVPWLPLALASGCLHMAPTDTAAQRSATFSAYTDVRVGSERLDDYIKSRVGFVSAGLIITRTTEMPGGRLAFHGFSLGRTFNIGTAAAIDRRGYFLTAAHVVTKEPVYVGWLEPDPRGNLSLLDCPARVVWRGNVARGQPDIAVLCVDRPLPSVFSWAPRLRPGEPVISAGLDYRDLSRPENDFTTTVLAGVIKRVSRPTGSRPSRTVVLHTTPVHEGDSGGPLTDVDGRLIAVNDGYAFVFPYLPVFHTYRAYSHRPDLAWLHGLIGRDAAAEALAHQEAGAGAEELAGTAGASSTTLRTRSMSASSLKGLAM